MIMLRRSLAAALAGLAVGLVAPAAAEAKSAFCSPTGDFCFSARRVGGRVTLQLDTFSFRGRVRTCVRPPAGSPEACRAFRLRHRGNGLFGFRARWSAHFPNPGPGTYRVRFSYQGTRLGSPVTFAVSG
jgi:hypothetical protein